ncbi:Rhomboid protein 1 [Escovopsis weberi]|uniref:Rhomboid protein 1 n=1 Tax=Escovopsis weberi TaxID=150374 RepID=A0A0M8MTI0_ESCWE|nr:Rhomboid protein 1 [Escovopsis weberi]
MALRLRGRRGRKEHPHTPTATVTPTDGPARDDDDDDDDDDAADSLRIGDYEELPRAYRDQAGLSFGRELSEEETDRIFGTGTGAARANRLLRILHGRRVAGTLEDPAFAVHTAQFDADEMAVALAYLRRQVPVEEVRNAGLRAEDELDQMDKQLRQRQEDEQKRARDGKDKADEVAVEYKVDPRYGPSKFDEMRARNLAREKAREKALEEEMRVKELDEQQQQGANAGPLARREDGSRAITNPKVQEYYDKAQSGLEAPPEMRAWERILPSATVVALVLGFLAAVAAVYEEPAARYRLLREVSTAQATVGALIAANLVVFLGWRVPPLWALFNRSMMLVVATVRPATLFTAAFSHTRLSHLLANMVPLWFVGTALHGEVGRADFLALYLGCGAAGFLSALVTYTLRGWLTVTSMGASGATLGLCSAYFWEHRQDGFRILGLPENGVHGIVFLAMMTALQLAALGRTVKLRVDVASHLGGMAAGILGIEMINRTARGRRRRGKPEKETATDEKSERGAK